MYYTKFDDGKVFVFLLILIVFKKSFSNFLLGEEIYFLNDLKKVFLKKKLCKNQDFESVCVKCQGIL